MLNNEMMNKCHDIANRAITRHLTKTEFLDDFEKSGGNYYCFTPDELVILVKLAVLETINAVDKASYNWTEKPMLYEVKREALKQFELP